MQLSEFEIKRVQRLFEYYCDDRIPLIMKGKLKLEYRIRDNEVILYESRVPYNQVDVWYSTTVARFLKDNKHNLWHLFSSDRNDDWIEFHPYPSDRNIEQLIAVVNEDITGIFFG